MTWLKRTLATLAVLLAVALVLSALAYRKLHGTPDWYTLRTLTAEQLESTAHSAENKLTTMQNWAAQHRAQESAARRAATSPAATTAPATTKPAAQETATIEFTEDELNALFQKWVSKEGWSDRFGKYVTDPILFLQDNHIILAGKVHDLGTVASVQVEPKLIDNGTQLDLRPVHVYGGNLPLPKAVWSSQRDKLTRAVAQQMPAWRQKADIQPNGVANLQAVSVGLSKILLNVLNDQPSDPVIFLPVVGGTMPARLTAIAIADKTLSLTVTPMTPPERQAFLDRLKGNQPETASAR